MFPDNTTFLSQYQINETRTTMEYIRLVCTLLITGITANNVGYFHYIGCNFMHSCRPNCRATIKDGILTVTAVRDLVKGEMCTISRRDYAGGSTHIDNVIERRKRISTDTTMHCTCDLCMKQEAASGKRYCFVCSKGSGLSKCARCDIYYCSRECQTDDWKLGHKTRCGTVTK